MNTFLYLQKFSYPKDCLMKSFQNFSLMLSYIFNNNKNFRNKSILLSGIILDARRTMGFFGFLDSINGLKLLNRNKQTYNAILNKHNKNVFTSSLLESIFENIDFLIGKKILKGNQNFFTRTYCILWIGNITAIIMKNFYELKQIKDEKENNNNVKEIKRKKLEIVSYLCDLPVALNGSGLIKDILGTNFNRGIIGLTGMIAGSSRYYLYYVKNKINI